MFLIIPSLASLFEVFDDTDVTIGIILSTACVWHGASPKLSGVDAKLSMSTLLIFRRTGGSVEFLMSTRSSSLDAFKFRLSGFVKRRILVTVESLK